MKKTEQSQRSRSLNKTQCKPSPTPVPTQLQTDITNIGCNITVLLAFIQILSGPRPVLFVSPVSPNLPDLFHCFVLWSSLSIACWLSLYLFAIVWCVSSKFYVLWSSSLCCLSSCMSLYHFSFVWCVSLLYLFSALVFLSSLCIVNKLVFHRKKKKMDESVKQPPLHTHTQNTNHKNYRGIFAKDKWEHLIRPEKFLRCPATLL